MCVCVESVKCLPKGADSEQSTAHAELISLQIKIQRDPVVEIRSLGMRAEFVGKFLRNQPAMVVHELLKLRITHVDDSVYPRHWP